MTGRKAVDIEGSPKSGIKPEERESDPDIEQAGAGAGNEGRGVETEDGTQSRESIEDVGVGGERRGVEGGGF